MINMSEKEKSRLFINVLKGIAIFLMFWGHCIQYCTPENQDFFTNKVFIAIYSFHMPLFMLISGYLFSYSFSKRTLRELIVHRTQAMIQPLLLGTVFIFFTTTVISNLLDGNIDIIFSGGYLSNLQTLWFFWSVIASSIVVAISCKLTKSLFLRIVFLIAGILFVAVFPCSDSNVKVYPYFVLGFLFNEYKPKIPKKLQHIKYLSLIVFPIMLIITYKTNINVADGMKICNLIVIKKLIKYLFRWALGLAGSVFVITITEIVFNFSINHSKKIPVVNAFSIIGKNSLQMYVLSVSFISYWLRILFVKISSYCDVSFITDNFIVFNIIFTPIISILFCIIIYFFYKLLIKIRISHIIFGR